MSKKKEYLDFKINSLQPWLKNKSFGIRIIVEP